jgi:type IV secretion system protein VirB4
MAVEGYPDDRAGGRLDFLHALAVPYRWSSRFIPVGQRAADKLIRRHRQAWFAKRKDFGTFVREMASNKESSGYERQREDDLFGDQDATAMLRDLNAAQAANAAGAVRYGLSTQVVVVADPDPARSAAHAGEVVRALHDHGFTARIETVNAPEAFFGSLPGHGYQNLRRPLLHSKNLADLWPLTSVWPGLPTNPSQYFPAGSPPLMHVATDGSTPFRLNLHVGDVGHAVVVGATGAGKSTLLGLVQAQWQRYAADLGAQTVVFDYDYSHWLLARACGAQHYDLCAGRPDAVAFQPLADVDRPGERAWAGGWLEVLLELQGVAVTPGQRGRLARALALLGEQPPTHRTLTEFVTQVQDTALREALRSLPGGRDLRQLFDASGRRGGLRAVPGVRAQAPPRARRQGGGAGVSLPRPSHRAPPRRTPDAHDRRGGPRAAQGRLPRPPAHVAAHAAQAQRRRGARLPHADAARPAPGEGGHRRELAHADPAPNPEAGRSRTPAAIASSGCPTRRSRSSPAPFPNATTTCAARSARAWCGSSSAPWRAPSSASRRAWARTGCSAPSPSWKPCTAAHGRESG